LLYFFNYDYNFFYNYDKFLYFDIHFTKTFYFLEDFVIKAESRFFVMFRHYFEHFRRLKYNEYLITNKTLYEFPLLKKLLHANTGKIRKEFIVDFRKNVLFEELYNIYEVKAGDTENDFKYTALYNKPLDNLLRSLPFLEFFQLFSKSPYLIAVDKFKPLMGTYLLLKAYHLYYLFNRKRTY
jgi:hypothetical protein